jgi:transcriptional regulator with XRE-family HTH domain
LRKIYATKYYIITGDKMAFGNTLRDLIEINNLTQKQLGKELNIAPSTIGNYVRSIREPDHSTLIEIAKYFNVSTDYLLGHSCKDKLNHDEEAMINVYRKLGAQHKKILYKEGLVILEVQNDKNK